jgi:hypothetical protein
MLVVFALGCSSSCQLAESKESSDPAPTATVRKPQLTLEQARRRAAEIIEAWKARPSKNDERLLLATEAEQQAFEPGVILGGAWVPGAGPQTWQHMRYHNNAKERIWRDFYYQGEQIKLVTEEMIPIKRIDNLSLRGSWKNVLLITDDGRAIKLGDNVDAALSDEALFEQADQLCSLIRTRQAERKSEGDKAK